MRTKRLVSTTSMVVLIAARGLFACSSDGSSGGSGDSDGGADAASSGGAAANGGASASGGASSGGSNGSGGTASGGNGNGGNGSGGAGSGGTGAGGTASGGNGGGGVPVLGTPIEPGDPGTVDVTFDIRSDQGVHRISPLVYGTNGGPEIATTHQTVIRSGGNRLTAYNWENNASNAGSDWYFQNDGLLSSSDTPGQTALDVVDEATSNGAAAVVTVPIVDYVAADKNGGGDVRNSGADYLTTRFRKNVAAKAAAFATSPDVNDDSVYEDEFVSFLKGARGSANILFSLDNEPDLWSSTHAEVHPDPVTYAELWERNARFSSAIKGAWPEAKVLGFVSYGFNGYVTLQNAPDANGRDFLEWYLDQASAADAAQGKRLVDYLDLHWYPEAQGAGQRITGGDNTTDVVTAREQAPRSLWDPSYLEDSWIVSYKGGAAIDLLHWLRAKIDGHYPGTELSFTEWNYGGGDHISGAIAVADVLGIFGREGVGLATYWGLKSDETFALAGFRAYRNYDGNGGTFGDTSISAETSDAVTASVYASVDSANPTRAVLVLVNKGSGTTKAGIRVAHPQSYTSAAVYVLTGSAANFAPGTGLTAVATNAFAYDMPAQSVSVVVPAP